MDETLSDVTHKVILGDEVEITIPMPSGNEASIKAEVPIRAELDLNIWRIDVAGVRSMNEVEEAVEWMKSAYAQVGVKINATIDECPWPAMTPDPSTPGVLNI